MIHKVAPRQEDTHFPLKVRLLYSYLLGEVSDIHRVTVGLL